MSEALIGVAVGGVIGLFGSVIVLIVEYKKWSKDRKYNHLLRKRERMEALFLKVRTGFPADLVKGRFSIDAATDVLHLCPRSVQSVYWAAVQDHERTAEKISGHLAALSMAMKAVLADIDKQMDDA